MATLASASGACPVGNLQLRKRAFEVKLDFEFITASHGFPRMGQGIAYPTESISEQRIDLMARPIADMGKDRMRAGERTGEASVAAWRASDGVRKAIITNGHAENRKRRRMMERAGQRGSRSGGTSERVGAQAQVGPRIGNRPSSLSTLTSCKASNRSECV